ncbi:ABC transporter ATP-binding protein [Actinomyces sp. 2119]|uniref:ABC transporter ATP-binding protein n=1 Tax=Actinomyces lilanjuaniae TaxID=2321394 RepID=A0ABM6Z4J3_9ACTO|nr:MULTISPECIES: ABC transporter ATP-binding protein [Actinomyces]AYD90251.1 ABC transporter ATP-binding protein [Actinomyces lilanjuaniae]RJF41515.1 ABC transporter ATP-binding protein [Actinomyces sp. 2119]
MSATVGSAAVSVEAVSKRFRVYRERNNTLKSALMRRGSSSYQDFQALEEVSLEIPQGSTFALVGDNGSGKSTLLKCIARILVPDSGTIRRRGRMAAMLEVGSGFHPELSGRENIYLNGSILGMSRSEIDAKLDQIVDFSGVEAFIDQPVKNYSSGMYVRLGFSVAIHTEPEILLVDEILAVGDTSFQEKCAQKFADLRDEGRTVVVVSHSLPQLRSMADQAAYLDHGRLKAVGPARVVLEQYADAERTNIRTDDNGRVRWGTGEVVVERVEVIGPQGPVGEEGLVSGDQVVLRLHYHATRRVERPSLGLTMDSAQGSYLWASFSRDQGFSPDYLEGRGSVDLVIPHLPLQEGLYAVHGGVLGAGPEEVFDFVREIAWLQVGTSDPRDSGGPVSMAGRWRMSGQTRTAVEVVSALGTGTGGKDGL